jgi:hypothetical protein
VALLVPNDEGPISIPWLHNVSAINGSRY